VPDDGASQYRAFAVTAYGGQLGGRHGMVDACDILFDDRPLVQVAGHVVRRGADQLDTTFEGLLVRSSALKARKERARPLSAEQSFSESTCM
jgi:hypothetical protein